MVSVCLIENEKSIGEGREAWSAGLSKAIESWCKVVEVVEEVEVELVEEVVDDVGIETGQTSPSALIYSLSFILILELG